MPEVFGISFLVAGLMLLRSAYLSGSRLIYGVSILFFVLAYGAKETNLFSCQVWYCTNSFGKDLIASY